MPTIYSMQLQLHPLLEAKIALDRMTSPTSAHFHPAAADNDMDFNQLDLSEGATALNRRRFKVKITPSGKLLKCLLFVDIQPIRDRRGKQEAIKRWSGGKMQGLTAYNMLVTNCNRSRMEGRERAIIDLIDLFSSTILTDLPNIVHLL